jgi:hypothetical protein
MRRAAKTGSRSSVRRTIMYDAYMTACGHKGREVDKVENRATIIVIGIPDSDVIASVIEAGSAIIIRKL